MSVTRDGGEGLSPEDLEAQRKALGLDLPDLVTGPGKYLTRSGIPATILRVTGAPPYNCIGVIHASGAKSGIHAAWAASGRYRASGESPNDLVKKR